MPTRAIGWTIFLLVVWTLGLPAQEKDRTQEQIKTALSIRPIQSVNVDTPGDDELAKCRIERAVEAIGIPGWVIYDASGKKLRQFLDTDGDKKLDVWQFFRNGVEVYREIDTNKDDKRNEFRWLGMEGTRWGVDENQDGKIDSWKQISPEEVAAEVFYAIRDKNPARFKAVLLTETELGKLGLRSDLAQIVGEKLKGTQAGMAAALAEFKKLSPKGEFAHFGSSTPSMFGKDFDKKGNQEDIYFYEHSSAVFSDEAENGKSYGQISLGTMIKTPAGWRVIEIPVLMQEGKVVTNGGLLMTQPSTAIASTPTDTENGDIVKLFEEFEEVESKLRNAAPGAETEKLQQQRVDVLLKLALQSSGENQANWIRQLADTVANAYESGAFDKGLDALMEAGRKLGAEKVDVERDYIAWRVITARYAKSSDGSSSERAAASERFQKDLEAFIKSFPDSEFAPEGLNQMALYAEVNGTDEESLKQAIEIYKRIEKEFPNSKWALRAKGARNRLDSIGKKIEFTGKTINDQRFDLNSQALNGKVVILHFWATWCDACVKDFAEYQRLSAKYKDDLVVVGVNLDDSYDKMKEHLSANPQYKWTQLYAPGGVSDSPLATQLGVSTLPLILLIDQKGLVVDTGLSARELDRSIQRLLR